MTTEGTIIKLATKDTGTIFYRIEAVHEGSCTIIPLCRVRKGYLTVKYKSSQGSYIYISQIGVHYLIATKKELGTIKEILNQSATQFVESEEISRT